MHAPNKASWERLAKRYEGDKEGCRYLGELFPVKFPFSEDEWNRYANGRLCAKAFDVHDFESAKHYGKKCTSLGKVKQICSQNKCLFELYRMLKRIRKNIWYQR